MLIYQLDFKLLMITDECLFYSYALLNEYDKKQNFTKVDM